MDERLSDIVEECLERLEAGISLEQCLASYPLHHSELEELLNAILQVQEYPWPTMPTTTRATIENRLLTELATQQADSNASTPPVTVQTIPSRPMEFVDRFLRAVGYRGRIEQPWRRLVAIGFGLVLALTLGTGALAAARAIMSTIAPSATPVPTSTLVPSDGALMATLLPSATLIQSPALTSELRFTATATQSGAPPPVPTMVQTLLPSTEVVETAILPSPIVSDAVEATATTTPTVMLSAPPTTIPTQLPPTSTPIPTETSTATLSPLPTATQTATHSPTPTETPTPTQLIPATAPVAPVDSFEELRALITAGVDDGRAERAGGQFLLKKLEEAQEAAIAGNISQLENRLRNMRLKTDEEIRTGKMDSGFGQEVLDGIAEIAKRYNIQLSQ
jgi:hypothetical protein